MKIRNYFYFITVGLVLLFVCTRIGEACSCISSPISEYLKDAKYVFIGSVSEGKVVDHEKYSGRKFKFQVTENLKGKLDKSVWVHTGIGYGDCGSNFTIGRRYLVFVYRNSKNELSTGICSGNQELGFSEKFDVDNVGLTELRSLLKK